MTTLVLIRHGNTFDKGDVILRVGSRTDLTLSSSGRAQADQIGFHLRDRNLLPGVVMVSGLKRTQETAARALAAAGHDCPVLPRAELNEIDYGPDDGQPESAVIDRIGQFALDDWEAKGIMPPEWSPRPEQIAKTAENVLASLPASFKMAAFLGQEDTMWAVTSNGIGRFFGQAVAQWDCPRPDSLKLSTAAYAVLQHDGKVWRITEWNVKC